MADPLSQKASKSSPDFISHGQVLLQELLQTSIMLAEDFGAAKNHQILLVDDEPSIRTYCKYVLQAEGMTCDEAGGGEEALRMAHAKSYDLLILDVDMGDLSGVEVCRQLREQPPGPNLKIILASGNGTTDMMAQMLPHGVDDFLTKPFSVAQLQARVKATLNLKDAQDRSELLKDQLHELNLELQKNLSVRDGDLMDARNALVMALAKFMCDAAGTRFDPGLIQAFKHCAAQFEKIHRDLPD
jgi:DNA-binding response OmpR family regulator